MAIVYQAVAVSVTRIKRPGHTDELHVAIRVDSKDDAVPESDFVALFFPKTINIADDEEGNANLLAKAIKLAKAEISKVGDNEAKKAEINTALEGFNAGIKK